MSPYRIIEPIKAGPSFTYIERCYMSPSKAMKLWAHSLMLGKDTTIVIGIIILLVAIMGIMMGIFSLANTFLVYVSNRFGLPIETIIFGGIMGGFSLMIFGKLYQLAIRDNRKAIEWQIQKKLGLNQTATIELPLAEPEEEYSLIMSRIQDECSAISEEVKRIHS